MGSSTPQCRDALAIARAAVLPSGLPDTVGATGLAFSELINFRDTQLAPAPVQRFGSGITAAPTWLGGRASGIGIHACMSYYHRRLHARNRQAGTSVLRGSAAEGLRQIVHDHLHLR